MYRLGLFNVEVWTLAWPTDFISRTQWLVFPSFIYLLIHKVEVLNSNSTLYCSFVFCGLCLWCFAQNTTHTTHQCEVVFLSRRFNSWKLHIFLQLSVVQVFGAFTINGLEVSSPYYHIFEQVSSLLSILTLARKINDIYPQIPSTNARHSLYKEIQSLSSFLSYIFHCYPALVACCALTQKPSLCK